MDNLERVLHEHPLLRGLPPEQVKAVADCAAIQRFQPGDYLLREGQQQGKIYLIREGTVAIESVSPGGAPTTIETVGPGDVVGLSWLVPARAHFDCRARDGVFATVVDQIKLRTRMEKDTALGYALASRLLELTYARLARLRLVRLDVYR